MHRTASTGAVTLIQSFGSADNLSVHFHMLLLHDTHVVGRDAPRFQRVKARGKAELDSLVRILSERVGRYVECQGLFVRSMGNGDLALEPRHESGLEEVFGGSITYRIAIGPQQDCKAFTLQTLPPKGNLEATCARVAKASGFLLRAGLEGPVASWHWMSSWPLSWMLNLRGRSVQRDLVSVRYRARGEQRREHLAPGRGGVRLPLAFGSRCS